MCRYSILYCESYAKKLRKAEKTYRTTYTIFDFRLESTKASTIYPYRSNSFFSYLFCDIWFNQVIFGSTLFFTTCYLQMKRKSTIVFFVLLFPEKFFCKIFIPFNIKNGLISILQSIPFLPPFHVTEIRL